jgi:hypothetical protein
LSSVAGELASISTSEGSATRPVSYFSRQPLET